MGLRVWWLWVEVGGFGLLWKRDRWLLVKVMGLGCCGRRIGGCGFGRGIDGHGVVVGVGCVTALWVGVAVRCGWGRVEKRKKKIIL